MMFPWIEANQGFLSLLALVAALGIALFEYLLLLHARHEAFLRDVEIAIDIVNKVEVYLAAIPSDVVAQRAGLGELAWSTQRAIRALTAMAAARAHSAMHALMMQEAIQYLESVLLHSQASHMRAVDREQNRRLLAQARDGLVLCRPESHWPLKLWAWLMTILSPNNEPPDDRASTPGSSPTPS